MSETYSASQFRRSTLLYTGGRLLNALVAFVVFVWLARYMAEDQYAHYIAAFACLEVGLIVSGLGMEWVTAVYIPQVRLKGTSHALSRFVWSCGAIQAGLLLTGSAIYLVLADPLEKWLHLKGAADVFQLYAVVMLLEGVSRVFRDQLLSCLLLQGAAQFSQLIRNLIMLAFALSLASNPDWQTAVFLARAELLGSLLSLMVSAYLLHRYLRSSGEGQLSGAPDWTHPPWRDLLRAGRNAWLSNLANLSWGGQAVILIATRLIGSEATAVLGFTRNLAEQIRKYLPMEFLFGVFRSLLIARYVKDGSRPLLGLRVGLVFRVNLYFLLPLIVLTVSSGDQLCAILSNDRYTSGQWFLLGWLFILVFWAHHRLTDLLAHVIGRSDLTSRSSFYLLPIPILVVITAKLQAWPALFLVLAGAEFMYSAMILRKIDFYIPNWNALLKLVVGALLATVMISLPTLQLEGKTGLMVQGLFSYALLTIFMLATRAWSREEREVLSTLRQATR